MKKFLIYTIFTLFNISIILLNFNRIFKKFLHLTIISFLFSTFYFTLIWFFELFVIIYRNDYNRRQQILVNKFYKWMKERIFIFAFTTSLTVCLGYWILCLGGESIMIYNHNILNYYLHILVGLQMIIELILIENNFKHKNHFGMGIFIVCTAIMIYTIMIIFVAKKYNFTIYPFLNLEIKMIVGIFIGIASLSLNVYLVIYFVIEKKNENFKLQLKENRININGNQILNQSNNC